MAPKPEITFKRSLKLREVYKNFFDMVKAFVATDLETATLSQVKYHSDTLSEYYREFLKIQSTIEDYDEKELESNIRIEMDRQYFAYKPLLDEKQLNLKEARKDNASSRGGNVKNEELSFTPKLPDLMIEIFEGAPEKWRAFIESYNNHIHNNTKLNDMTKFQYLRNLTKGEGARPIQSIEFIADNYEEARRLLIDRFDKPNQIAEHHIRGLFSLKRIEKATSSNILFLLDEVNSHLRSLQTLGRPTNYWDDLIIHLIVTKLDSDSRAKWREFAPSDCLPSFKDMTKFLNSRSHKLLGFKIESSSSGQTSSQSKQSSSSNKYNQSRSSLQVSKKTYHCVLCNTDGHTLMRCQSFKELSIADRRSTAERMKLCFNCLRTSHSANNCPNTGVCLVCKSKHHTLLHLSPSTTASTSPLPSSIHTQSTAQSCTSATVVQSSDTAASLISSSRASNYVILATALVEVFDKFDSPIIARALLDSGSQVDLMTESFASRLGIKTSSSSINLLGLGCSDNTSSQSAIIRLRSRLNHVSMQLEVQLLPKIIVDQPSIRIDSSQWSIPSNIKLADPKFNEPRKVDLLLGADMYLELQSIGLFRIGKELPFLQNTQLGWVVAGRTLIPPASPSSICTVTYEHSSERLDQLLERFWAFDDTANTTTSDSIFDTECDQHFVHTYSRDATGRFIVRLPFVANCDTLGDSSTLARKRFLNVERRLNKYPKLHEPYHSFMSEYLALGHMKLVTSIEHNNYYLPHHCVLKADSSSTPLRVVFDGSAKSSSGMSLNDTLMNGPVVQNDLFANILRFRTHAFAMSADITKMYRQIKVNESDQQYQYIFWRFNSNEPIQTYKLTTVTYGTKSAPYQATRCLLQLAIDSANEFPAASVAIQNDFYVDNLLTGANSIEQAIQLKSEITTILKGAGLPLRKWCANNLATISDIPDSDREQFIHFDEGEFIKTLGLFWQSNLDNLRVNVNSPSNETSKVTKRIVISEVAKIFDPIGLVSPIVVCGKLFMQVLWNLRVDWDEALSMQHHTFWCNFRAELPKLNSLLIPRHLFKGCVNPTSIQLHGFADASERAYGAAIYVRSILADETVHVALLCSKSRVAPMKKLTIPRLELCAMQLLVHLVQKVLSTINFSIDEIFYWSDSMIALYWLNSPASRWQTFVANRVADIQRNSIIKNWHHVKSEMNPADMTSRGALPKDIISSQIWWNGPLFLQSSHQSWQEPLQEICVDEVPEQRIRASSLIATRRPPNEILWHLEQVTSSYEKLLRIASYMSRFYKNAQNPSSRSSGPLSVNEIINGTNLIVRLVQMQCFPELYVGLQGLNYVVRDSALKSLSLFIDSDRIIRVGGRLQCSALSYSAKHPALLPHDHYFTLMIANFFHRKNLHVGPQGLLAFIRQQFWPINGRQIVKSVCRNCVLCSRVRPRFLRQQMADLPQERVSIAPPFYNVGVDYAGPFYIHYRIRGKSPTKTYLAIFVCLATKAVHLELASDLTTASFIGAFRRFIATRGLCKKVFSDNGTNFVGANAELHELYQLLRDSNLNEKLHEICDIDKIEWTFMPAGSPHFGGIYEAAVKSAKFHLRRIIGSSSLTYEELNTLFKQVEAVLNSRPLVPLASDNELDVLTPGHFLIGRPLNAIAEVNLQDDRNLSYLKRWELVNYLYKTFWSCWSRQYLQELQHRYYWQDKHRNLPLGSIVMIKDDNQPPLKWKLGRVIALHPGADNLVRVVTLKTASGTTQRSITKLCPLPIEVEPGSIQGGEDEHDH